MEEIIELLKAIGFKDVTKDNPIKVYEQLLDYNNAVCLTHRFNRTLNNLVTTITFGEDRGRFTFHILSRFNSCGQKYHDSMPTKYCMQSLIYALNVVECKVISTYYINKL